MFDPSKNLKRSEKFVQSRRKIDDFIANLNRKASQETLLNEFYKWEEKTSNKQKKDIERDKLPVLKNN
jgi:hypothetical protein